MNVKTHAINSNAFATSVADFIIREGKKCIENSGVFRLLLSGGNTPVSIFKELVNQQNHLDWGHIELFWVDERCVAVESEESNFGTCKRHLIDNLQHKPKSYPMYYSGNSQDSAISYQKLLKKIFNAGGSPVFDLVLLGVGVDGHVASLFPGSNEMRETMNWVVSTLAPSPPKERITLTFPVINAARKIIIIAKGGQKKWVYEAYSEHAEKADVPVCNVKSESSDIVWFVSF